MPDEDAAWEQVRKRATAWIWLGVYALLAAGLLSLSLAIARTPVLKDLLPGTDFFHVALVVHVDLSVLVWFMACAGMVWTAFGAQRITLQNTLAFYLAVAGTVMISVAPFVGADRPLMNNYVPVLQHPWFLCGLATLAAGIVLQALDYLRGLRISISRPDYGDMLRIALAFAAVLTLIAVATVLWTLVELSGISAGESFYEVLFWGGGHILQFANSVLVLAAWFVLGRASGSQAWLSPRIGIALFAVAALPVLVLPFLYQLPIGSVESFHGYTALMRWGGLATLPLGVAILVGFVYRHRVPVQVQPLRAVLLCSLTLFAAGGFLGFLIQGSSTMIPAHYHGSIVAVTLAFMGVVYYLLPNLGYPIKRVRLLRLQPYIFAGGQLMHITGLAMSGGYGVQRKVAGADQLLDGFHQTLGMAMMGTGGLLAVVGGLCFLLIAVSALRGGDARVARDAMLVEVQSGATGSR